LNYYNFTKTKIIATIGPACEDKNTLVDMVHSGMDVARLNFSHGDHPTHEHYLNLIREINEEYNTNIAILQDLQGPKIRMGEVYEPYHIKSGDIITFRSDISERNEDLLPIVYDTFAQDVRPGDMVLVNDGKVELQVVETDRANTVKLKVIYGDLIESRKGVNLPRTKISIATVTEKDYRDIEFAIKHNVEWLALSFVRSADDIRFLKELIRLKNGKSRVIAKIEKQEALNNIDEIIEAADAIMVARGDLGVEIPMEDVPSWQKKIVKKCNRQAKPVIVATQVMESMMENNRPTRAETSDVANAVVDGADAVMLSGETSVGKFPREVVASMNRIISRVESEDSSIFYRNMELSGYEKAKLAGAIIITACSLAQETGAKAIVGMTQSGYTAFQLSHCRPKSEIFIFTNNKHLIRTFALIWGIRGIYYDKFDSTDETIKDVKQILKESGFIKVGDVIINTGSMPLHERGFTNMVRISEVK
jgi:pyruvate kinase